MSDDGESAIVIIALLGNPFSPDYFRAREHGPVSALPFCSMNVAVYGRKSAWTFHERKVQESDRRADALTIGTSSMRWDGGRLIVDLDERTSPFDRRVRGQVILHPEAQPRLELPIDARGQHRWWPVAPLARIEVDLPQPGVRFSGHGYHDANAGDVPLEWTFDSWTWSRARAPSGAILTYDLTCVGGEQRSLAFEVARDGSVEHLDLPWRAPLQRSLFGLPRRMRADVGHPPRIVRSLEDGPFYARALVETQLAGRRVIAVHEELAAHRLRRAWVRFCTSYRMRVDR